MIFKITFQHLGIGPGHTGIEGKKSNEKGSSSPERVAFDEILRRVDFATPIGVGELVARMDDPQRVIGFVCRLVAAQLAARKGAANPVGLAAGEVNITREVVCHVCGSQR